MDDEQSEIVLGRGCRQRQQSTRLRDYVLHTVQRLSSSSSPSASSLGHTHSLGSPYPITHYVNYDKFSLRHRAFLAAVTAGIEPSSFTEAVKDEKWRDVMRKEIQALEDNETWTVESLPPGKQAINCKWVYKIKYNADGTIERYKARLVILGNKQVVGIDYNETFAPVAKMVTVRALLAVAAAKHWELHQMDVHNAFLHGDLEEEVYMRNDHATIKVFKEYLSRCFHMRDLGMLKYFLGIEAARSPTGIFLCQRKYALDIISEVGLLGAKPASFPLEPNHNLALADGAFLSRPESYRRLVGRLIYLSVTRPKLSYSVHVLAQFMQQPREEHWAAALCVVRYLKGNPGQGIMLRSDCDLQLSAWCDSDWASCPLTRRSLTGWFILLGNSPISWKTKKQHTVSRSSAEAEYRSMAATTCELKWLKELLLTLGVEHIQ
ncbi:protein kinase domain-containing protein [Citrus sinensis]|nr:protein kinase domain-containing protein [Citrus sinensis]